MDWRRVIGVLLLGVTLAAGTAQAHPEAEGEDVVLRFAYDRYAETYLMAWYADSTLYVPLAEVFTMLSLQARFNPERPMVDGHVLGTPFRLDGPAGVLLVGKTRFPADSSVVRWQPDGAYVATSLFESAWGLNLTINWSSLTLRLTTDLKLPVVQAYERAERKRLLALNTQRQQAAPLRYARRRAWARFGVVDYRQVCALSDRDARCRLTTDVGSEVLGGSLHAGLSVLSAADGTAAQVGLTSLAWRYVARGQRLAAGRLTADGLARFRYDGLTLTNRPNQPSTRFATFDVETEAYPGWEVEVYRNSQLVAMGQTDDFGIYQAPVAIDYGSTVIREVLHSPTGLRIERERRVQVPRAFVPAGTLYYVAAAGTHQPVHVLRGLQRDRRRSLLMQGRLEYGLSEAATVHVGMETPHGLRQRTYPYGRLLLRQGAAWLADVTVAPGVRTEGTLTHLPNARTVSSLTVRQAAPSALYNPFGLRRHIGLQASRPVHVRGLRLNSQGYLMREVYANSVRHAGSLNLSSTLGAMVMQLGVSGRHLHLERGSQLKTMRVQGGVFVPLRALGLRHPALATTLVRAQASYNPYRGGLQTVAFTAVRPTRGGGQVRLALGYDFANQQPHIGLTMAFNRAGARAEVHGVAAASQTLTQTLQGSVAYDPALQAWSVHRNSRASHAGVTIRMYHDQNANGQYDAGEPRLPRGRVRLHERVVERFDAEGYQHLTGLQPQVAYDAYLDPAEQPDPFLAPGFTRFRFVTDPHQSKLIDIPFYEASTVEGRVEYWAGDAARPAPGVTVHVRTAAGEEVASFLTFSDGTFYHTGLAPGTYHIALDADQAALAGYQPSAPYVLRITPENAGQIFDAAVLQMERR